VLRSVSYFLLQRQRKTGQLVANYDVGNPARISNSRSRRAGIEISLNWNGIKFRVNFSDDSIEIRSLYLTA